MYTNKTISNFYILGIIAAIGIPIIFSLLYYVDFETVKSPAPFYKNHYMLDKWGMDVKVWNIDRQRDFAIGDKLLFYINYTKTNEILEIYPSVYLEVGQHIIWKKDVREFDKISYLLNNSTIYSQIIQLNQTGRMVFGFDTQYIENKTENLSIVKAFHDKIPIDVRNISELEQKNASRVVYQGLIASSIIGSVTIIALIANSRISKNQSTILNEQKEIMKNESKFQMVEKRLAAYGSLLNFLRVCEKRAKGWGKGNLKHTHALEMPNGPSEFREIFHKNYYLFSEKVNEAYHTIIELDEDLELAPKKEALPDTPNTRMTDMPLSLNLKELQNIVENDYNKLKEESSKLSGHEY